MYKGDTREGILDDVDDQGLVGKEIGDKVGARKALDLDKGVSVNKRAVDGDVAARQAATHGEDMVLPLTGNEPHSTLRAKGQLTIPPEIRQAAHLKENAPVYFTITDQGILLRPGKVIDASQAWFWTERWQRMEREADASFAAGRHKAFDDAESFLADLDS